MAQNQKSQLPHPLYEEALTNWSHHLHFWVLWEHLVENSQCQERGFLLSFDLFSVMFLNAMHFLLFSMVGVACLKQPLSIYRETLKKVHQPDEFHSLSWALKGGSADYHFIQQFSYQLKGQNQYFSYTILVKSYCQDFFFFFAMGVYFIIKLLWEELPTYVEQFMLWKKAYIMMR